MNYIFSQKEKMVSYVLMGIGLAAIITGFATDSHRIWANLMVNNFFFLALGLFGTFFVAMQYLSQAGYGITTKRIPEAFSQYLFVAGPLMILILAFGHHDIYHWTHPGIMDVNSEHYDEIIANKGAFLNLPFFFIRAIIYLSVWTFCAHMLRKYSLQQDLNGGEIFHKKSINISVLFIVFFAVTICASSWDWLMSIDAHWYSTIFGWYIFAGLWVTGMVVMMMFILYLKNKGHLTKVNENHLHDIGKWMFAVSLVWAYLWLSQFLLIWYGNIPEEIAYFVYRLEHYKVLFFGMMLINFTLPFFVLMTRDSKRNPKFLLIISVCIFIGHWFDIYVMVMPGTVGEHWHLGFVEIGTFLGFLGLFLFIVKRSLAKVPLEIESHPYLEESIHLHH